MWYNNLEIHNINDRTQLGVHHFILSYQMCLKDCLLWFCCGFLVACVLCGVFVLCCGFGFGLVWFFPLSWKAGWRSVKLQSWFLGRGENVEGLDQCGFLLAKSDPATGGDLIVEQMLCSSEEIRIAASEKITVKVWGLWGKEKYFKNKKHQKKP